jgi:hypothetical protein
MPPSCDLLDPPATWERDMADYRAIEATGQSIAHVLRASYAPALFDHELEFQVYVREDFQQPMSAGVSVFLYRVVPNGALRTPTGRLRPDGQREFTRLPLDLHYLLTFWGRDATLQHRVAGWVMRQFEDTPILPFALLDLVAAGVFNANEAVELIPAELSNEDLFQIWEVLAPERGYELSLPYVARNIRIESEQVITEGEPVQERRADYMQKSTGT